MSEFATCPDCDEKVKVRTGKSSVKCPACGAGISVDKPSRGGGTARRTKDDDEEKKPKRKYRKEWDDDDDDEDDAPRKPPPRKGSLTWLWILLSVLAVVLASCGGAIWWFVTSVKKARDDFVQRVEEEQKQFNAGPGNPQGRPKAPVQKDATAYPKRKPFEVDPALSGGGPYYLSDLEPYDVSQGAWKYGRNGAMGADDGRWVVVNKVYYDHAVAMHPPEGAGTTARASFTVGGQVRRLKGKVALNDDWHDHDAWGTPTFTIYKDGKQIWSQSLKQRKVTFDFDLDVSGARAITLETKAEGSAHDAHCVWLDPVLEK
jgi:predicted RNA-binding Zn-ribbon protein involved in translation (DUF1610 family)